MAMDGIHGAVPGHGEFRMARCLGNLRQEGTILCPRVGLRLEQPWLSEILRVC